ncbi:hypothetical protein BU15DRAFT_67369 [Melanogaster broomeanus]|nr:hypothetical protein BU15DRAFT_67369 [Melanogaster broomeanus]
MSVTESSDHNVLTPTLGQTVLSSHESDAGGSPTGSPGQEVEFAGYEDFVGPKFGGVGQGAPLNEYGQYIYSQALYHNGMVPEPIPDERLEAAFALADSIRAEQQARYNAMVFQRAGDLDPYVGGGPRIEQCVGTDESQDQDRGCSKRKCSDISTPATETSVSYPLHPRACAENITNMESTWSELPTPSKRRKVEGSIHCDHSGCCCSSSISASAQLDFALRDLHKAIDHQTEVLNTISKILADGIRRV